MKRNVLVATAALASAMLACFGARAQTPGGVSPAVWYRTDAPNSVFSDAGTTVASNNATVQQWNEAQGNGKNLLQATASARPVFSNSSALANFNPTVTFDGSNDFLQFTAGAGINLIDRVNGSIYAAGYVNNLKQSGFAGFHASMDYPGLHVFGSNTKLLFFTGGPGYQGLSAASMKKSTFFTAGSGWQNGAGTNASYAAATVSLDGTRTDYSASQLYNANLSTGARDFRIGADNNYGAFSGQLNEVMVFEDKLTSDQMDRVETYLAIKYGTTYAAGTRDYKNSAGNTVWSTSANAGSHNNIAGIGRDDNGALHQKQSWSTNTGQQVLIGTGTLNETNAGNTAGLTNGQFLIWGDNGLARSPNVAIAGINGISHRFASIWKVQNTGNVGTVRVAWVKNLANLSLIQSADNSFDASDAVTNMSANEVSVGGVVYNYADVTLSNGQYFTFAAKVAAPGGVSGPAVWLKADQGTTLTGSTVSGWANYGNSGGVAGQLGRTSTLKWALPKYGANEHNFNPAIIDDVPATNDGSLLLADVFDAPAQRALSSFVLHSRDNVSSSENNMIAFTPLKMTSGALEAPYMAGYRGNRPWFYWQGPYENAPVLPNSLTRINNIPSVNGFYVPQWVSGTPHQTTVSMNGATATTPAFNINATSYPFGNQLFIFGDGNANNWSGGKISEVITYDRLLTDTEKLQINSYLSIKYGITLNNNGGTAVPNYLSSNSTVVWDATANAGYNKNVAGIANDSESTLNQKQSKSVNAGPQVLIATTGLTGTNAANGASLGNGQYLIWGDNGLVKNLSASHNTTVGGIELNLRFASVWKVQNTGGVGTVRVAWPSGIVNLHLIQSADNVINASDTHTPMSNTTSVNGVSYNYADVSLGNGTYFTFGGYIAGPGGVGQDLALWYKADSGVETDGDNKVTAWNNSTAKDVKLEMSSASAYIPYNNQTTKAWNFNPTLSFDGTNNYLRNTTTDYLNAAGSVHYITVARLNASATSYNSIFAISGNDDGFFLYPQGGQVYPMPAIGNGFGATAAGPGSKNRFGIYSAILPKTGTPVNQRGFYNGLEKVYTSPYPLTGGWYSLPTKGAYIGADGTTADNPKGDIAEVIVYHEPAGGDMNNANLAKIHSYLAIKYGVTLDQSAPQNYVNSGGGVVWNATNNAGYKSNIAGIARDDQGGLYQKQSASVNPGSQVVIGTTGLAPTNTSNSEPLSNDQFLIWGDNGLAKAPNVSLGTIGGLPYNRFAAIWKVENTGSVGTVRVAWVKGYANLKLIQSSDEVIDLTDTRAEMSSTITIGGKEYAYADVTLANGSYFTFAAFVQGPGGVTTNLTHWYRADYYLESDGDGEDASAWSDFNGGVVSTQLGEANLPKSKTGAADYFNFNPGVNFTATDQKLGNITERTLSTLDFDIFTATKESMAGGRFFNIGRDNATFNGTNWDSPGLYANGSIARRNNAGSGLVNGFIGGGNPNFSTNSPSIMYHTFKDVSVAKGLNGGAAGTPYGHDAMGEMTGGHVFGSNFGTPTSGDDGGIIGNVGEVIIYGAGAVSATDRNKVDSYLAIKYGVTLAAGTNYTTSTNAVIWNATANTDYHNNIAGIGNDFRSALHQKQSRNQHANTNNQVTIGLGGIAGTNAENTNQLTDGQFLVWGDNGNTQAMTNTAGTYTAFVYAGSINNARRMNRIWKVQNTNVSGETQIRFPKTSVGTTTLSNDACAGYVIIFASNAEFTSNVTAVPLTENGTDYEVAHAFPNGASYFTFGKVTPITTGTVYLPDVTEESNEYNDNCGTGEWTYFRNTTDATRKFFAASNLSPTILDNLSVKVTPEGVTYEEGSMTTRLMPRITTVTDASESTFTGGKVRIYYSMPELLDTEVPSAVTTGWFRYDGTAEEVIANVYAYGKLEAGKAVQVTPDASGVEDGVNYVEFHNLTSFSSFVYLSTTESSALPVALAYFNAAKEGNGANLTWATSEEVNNQGFEIQRSADARSWQAIGFVGSKTPGRDSKGLLTYNFSDAAPMRGINYYRLKQLDVDGSQTYSAIEALRFEAAKKALVVYPNPVVGGKLFLTLPQSGAFKLSVFNIAGVEVLKAAQSGNSVDISSLRTGVYVLRITYANGEVHSRTFAVN